MTKLILSKENIPFCLQLTETELKYYRKAVEKACKGNLSPFVNLVAVCVERSIDNYLNNVGYIDVVTLEEAMQDYNYTKEYLAYLVRKDRLRAYKKDNKVFIMKKDLESIVQSDICVELVTQK